MSKTKKLCTLMQQKSFWAGYRDRIRSQAIFATESPDGKRMLVCAPDVAPSNTISLRTGSPLWLTLASHVIPKPGAEVKAKVKAPEGFDIVSYDFDSQELSALGAFSSSYVGVSGSKS